MPESYPPLPRFWIPGHRVRGCVRPQVPNPPPDLIIVGTPFPAETWKSRNARPQAPLSFVGPKSLKRISSKQTFHSRQGTHANHDHGHARLALSCGQKAANFLVAASRRILAGVRPGRCEEFIPRATNTIPLTGTSGEVFHYHPDDADHHLPRVRSRRYYTGFRHVSQLAFRRLVNLVRAAVALSRGAAPKLAKLRESPPSV